MMQILILRLKFGLGDLDLSSDQKYLWTVNLFNRKIYKINSTTGAIVNSWEVPGITGPLLEIKSPASVNIPVTYNGGDLTHCAPSDVRPFGIETKAREDKTGDDIYVGIVCSAESLEEIHLLFYQVRIL